MSDTRDQSVATENVEQVNDNCPCSQVYRYDTRYHLRDRGRKRTVEVPVKALHRKITLIKLDKSFCSYPVIWNTFLSIFVVQSIFKPSVTGSISYHSIVDRCCFAIMLTPIMLTNHERARHNPLNGEHSLTIYIIFVLHTMALLHILLSRILSR